MMKAKAYSIGEDNKKASEEYYGKQHWWRQQLMQIMKVKAFSIGEDDSKGK